jgi:hypothetical protein
MTVRKCKKSISIPCGSSDFFEASLADLAVGEEATLAALAASTSKVDKLYHLHSPITKK